MKKGGKGSGNFGHSGRPGEIGGSGSVDSVPTGVGKDTHRALEEYGFKYNGTHVNPGGGTEHFYRNTKNSLRAKVYSNGDVAVYGGNDRAQIVTNLKDLKDYLQIAKGGKGSGNFGHSGRSGERGGSSSSGGGSSLKNELKQQESRLPVLERQRVKSEAKREEIRSRYRATLNTNNMAERDKHWKDLQTQSNSHQKLLEEINRVKSRIANIKADLELGKGLKAITQALKKQAEPIEIGAFLQAKIHAVFTHCADRLAMLGKLSTDDRIALSGAIGEALQVFRDEMEKNLPEGSKKILDPDDVMGLI